MKGVRFYQDENGCGIKQRYVYKSFPAGFNGIAVFHENKYSHRSAGDPMCEAIGAVYAGAGDGPYASTSASIAYVQKSCRRVSEVEARRLFPNLFKYLS